ncbi:MAG: hypothetical protein U5N86_07060 [Planctomycetota bacterium]|nr:hypothetical protein [Planctomycetota bacterium]
MTPVEGRWKIDDRALFAARGVVQEEDIADLVERITSSELAEVSEIYLDLNKVTFFSPYAASILFRSYSRVLAQGKRLTFLNPNEVTQFLLRLFGADYVFPVVTGV